MKKIFILVFVVSIFSCNQKEKNKSEEMIMYKQSEMAVLMNKMYNENLKTKQLIIEGKEIGDFPEEYLKIHTAVLTDPSDKTHGFKQFSDLYINNLKDVFEVSRDSLKKEFNEAVNSCIACHETTCIGPIPRIKKLLIK